MRRMWILAFVAACASKHAPAVVDDAPIPPPAADAITKDVSQGPATITVKVWPAKPTLGDSIWLRIEGNAPAGVTLDMPFDQEALGRFQVLRFAHDATSATYELSAPMSGKQRIPSLRVVMHQGTDEKEILTDEVPIDVGSILAEKTDRTLAPAKTELDTEPGKRTPWLLIGGIASGVLLLGLAIFLWFALRARRIRHAKISAWELAMRRLAELEARGAPDAEAADAWFVELSALVRAYVEGRYRLRAPELTTEEFLTEARRIPELADDHRTLLANFLETCDRVKFAGWRPASDESLAVIANARSFVYDSRPRDDARLPRVVAVPA
jgi:hypothetical protein